MKMIITAVVHVTNRVKGSSDGNTKHILAMFASWLNTDSKLSNHTRRSKQLQKKMV